MRFHNARYCEYPIGSTESSNSSYRWDYKSNSMTWANSWRGSRAALRFSKKDGPAFVVILTFTSLSDQGGKVGMDVHIESVMDCAKEATKKALKEFLVEDFTHGQGFQLTEAQKTLALEDQLMTIRVKKEMVFDEDIFIADCFFSSVKRGISEMTLESSQKRSKQSKSTKGEAEHGRGEIAGFSTPS